MMEGTPQQRIGVVAIGRNEGQRLRRCLDSVIGRAAVVIYVDSGSTDGSVEMARGKGVEVVDLDMSQPFTMGRGRNAGFVHLCEHHPELEFVHFVDGDCEVGEKWLEIAAATLSEQPGIAVVAGRRRERDPDASLYNRLTDMEWVTVPGPTAACGGDALMRVDALRAAGGFNPCMIAGEEAELCLRLRLAGHTILRLPDEMTRHDAAMFSFRQWWRRSVRAGHAYAEGAALHRAHGHNRRQVRSALFWGLLLPLAIPPGIIAGLYWPPALIIPALILFLYLVLIARITRYRQRLGDAPRHVILYAFFCIPAKVAHVQGITLYLLNRLRRRRSTLIEYKAAPQPRPVDALRKESTEATEGTEDTEKEREKHQISSL